MVEEYYATATSSVSVRRRPLSNRRLDAIIEKVLRMSFEEFTRNVSMDEIRHVCETTTNVLREQPVLVEILPPVVVCGDIHGQFSDLKTIFTRIGHPPDKKYIFLGDIVDRGSQNLETAVLLLCYKARFPDRFILLRGNHECSRINRNYGFLGEIKSRYGQQNAHEIWMLFNDTFAWLPYTALIGGRILCMHGGLCSSMNSLQQFRELRRPMLDPPNPSLELDVLWADPQPGLRGVRPSPRKAGVLFGEDVVVKLCQLLGLDLIVRAHQCVANGFEYFASRKLLTIFSAPGYSRRNTGATLTIDVNFRRSFEFF
uniref:Serine/threonine-protein phosphatase n=1 Tax=Globodera rostochiensis TaxID=31243 RepID=A0A914H4B7_GLORO